MFVDLKQFFFGLILCLTFSLNGMNNFLARLKPAALEPDAYSSTESFEFSNNSSSTSTTVSTPTTNVVPHFMGTIHMSAQNGGVSASQSTSVAQMQASNFHSQNVAREASAIARQQQLLLANKRVRQAVANDASLSIKYDTMHAQMERDLSQVREILLHCKQFAVIPHIELDRVLRLADVRCSNSIVDSYARSAIEQVQKIFFDAEGRLRVSENVFEAQEAIFAISKNFEDNIKYMEDYIERELLRAVLNEVDASAHSTANPLASSKKVVNNPYNKDLVQLKTMFESNQVSEARNLVTQYQSIAARTKSAVDKENARIIEVFFKAFEKAHGLTSFLQKKHTQERILAHFSIKNPSEKVSAIGLELVDLQVQPQAVADHLARTVSKDSKDPATAAAYDAFYENGRLKGYAYNEEARVAMPASIALEVHAEERSLLFKFGNFQTNGVDAYKKAITSGVSCIARACEDSPHQAAYRGLAKGIYNALQNKHLDDTVLRCHNLGAVSSIGRNALSGAGAEFAARLVDVLHSSKELSAIDRSNLQAALLGLDMLCGAALEGRTTLSDSVWESLRPLLSQSYKVDSEILRAIGADKVSIVLSEASAAAHCATEAFRLESAIKSGPGKDFIDRFTKLAKERPETWHQIVEGWQKDKKISEIAELVDLAFLHKSISLAFTAESFVNDPVGTLGECAKNVARDIFAIGLCVGENVRSADVLDFLTKPFDVYLSERPTTHALVKSVVHFFESPLHQKVNCLVSLGVDYAVTKAVIGLAKSGLYSSSPLAVEFNADWSATRSGRLYPLRYLDIKVPLTVEAIETQIRIDELIAQGANKTLWSKIEPTQTFFPNTSIPRSFNVNVQGRNLWVGGNATKHLAEIFNNVTERSLLMQERVLSDFLEGLEQMVAAGYVESPLVHASEGVKSTLFPAGDWKIGLGAPQFKGGYTKVIHIENIHWKN